MLSGCGPTVVAVMPQMFDDQAANEQLPRLLLEAAENFQFGGCGLCVGAAMICAFVISQLLCIVQGLSSKSCTHA